MDNRKELELKLKDYKRFIITLLLLSIYLYFGAVIVTYITPAGHGALLSISSIVLILVASWFIYQFRRLKAKLEERV